MDCDEQHEPAMIPEFVRQIETNRWDLISGSRYAKPAHRRRPAPGDRRKINGTITKLVNDLFSFNLTDAFCGYKAHRVSADAHAGTHRAWVRVPDAALAAGMARAACG